MNLFYTKIFYSILPVLIVLSFPFYVEYQSGEFLPLKHVINLQSETSQKSIYGPAYSDQTVYFKSEMVKNSNPEILALGNSKILTMRAGFFNQGTTFYNAGGTSGDIASFRKFIEVTNATPKILIAIVEPLHFDPSLVVRPPNNKKYESLPEIERAGSALLRSWVGVYQDYLDKKYTLKSVLERKRNDVEMVGLNARINGSGTRNDGSYHYGKQYENLLQREEKIQKAIIFISNKKTSTSTSNVSMDALDELEQFLALCKERNIYVIGFIPPTPKAVEDTYRKYPQYNFMFQTYEKTSPVFKKYNFPVYDFFSLASLGSNDKETIDEYHTSEKVMVRTLLKMSQSDPVLKKFVSQANLKELLNSDRNQNDIIE